MLRTQPAPDAQAARAAKTLDKHKEQRAHGLSPIELTVTLRVGPLTPVTVRDLRLALSDVKAGPATHPIVDLRETDDHNELSVCALLSERARSTIVADGSMTAVGPSRRLSHLLVATGIPVVRSPFERHATARRQELCFGIRGS